MADINHSIQSGASASGSVTIGNADGVPNNIRDDNTGTSYGATHVVAPTENAVIEYSAEVDFGETILTLNQVDLVHTWQMTNPYPPFIQWWIDLYYSSSWNVVASGSYSSSSGSATDGSSAGWSNVTKIRVRIHGVGLRDIAPSAVTHATKELRAWGPVNYFDVGLRMRTSGGTIKIGAQNLTGAHKLRIRKGGTIYGIPLLDTGHASASGVRIYDGSTVKALPEVA